MDYKAIGQSYVDRYNIILCPRETCTCWSRPHAHPKERKICKMPLPTGRKSLFSFLHEVGHIVHPRGGIKKELRAVEEYYATCYAKEEIRKHGISVSKQQSRDYDRYIRRCLARALRRGLKKVPKEIARFNRVRKTVHSKFW